MAKVESATQMESRNGDPFEVRIAEALYRVESARQELKSARAELSAVIRSAGDYTRQ